MKQNDDFKYLIQIPNFLSEEKCDELKKDIMESEQDVLVVSEMNKVRTQLYQRLEKLMSGIYVNKRRINLDQRNQIKIGNGYRTKCFKWLIS